MAETEFVDGPWADSDAGLWCDKDIPFLWYPDAHGSGGIFVATPRTFVFTAEYQTFVFTATKNMTGSG